MTDSPTVAERPHRRRSASSALEPRYLQFNGSVAEGGIPVAVFWVANSLGPSSVAITLSFIAAAVVFLRNRDSGVIRALSLLGFLIVAASAGAGLLLASDKAFAAQNIASDFAFVAISLGSVMVGKPLIGYVARELLPALRPHLEATERVFVILTLLNAFINLGTGIVRFWMLDVLETNDYVILSRVIGIPTNLAFFGLAYVLIKRRLAEVDQENGHGPDEPALPAPATN